MTIITLPPDLDDRLAEEARKRGTTPEHLAVEGLRHLFGTGTATNGGTTLFDFLAGYIGTVNGTTEALSENCGRRFAEGLAAKHPRGNP